MSFAITGVRIIDGTGRKPIENGFIIVDGKKIVDLGIGLPHNFEGETIQANGKTIMPGLINSHCHPIGYNGVITQEQRHKEPLSWANYRTVLHMYETLSSGVTYIRDCGSPYKGNVDLRDAVRKGIVVGPDVVACGQLITMTGGHGCVDGYVADGVEEVRKAVRVQLASGVDMVKIVATGGMMSGTDPGAVQYDREELAIAVHEASKAGKKVTTHCHGTQGIKNAIWAGIQCIEHGMFLDEEAAEQMAKQGTYWVPTLSAIYWMVHGENVVIPPSSMERAKRCLERSIKSFELGRKVGLKIAMGTDGGTPCNYHHAAWWELLLYIENGMTPMEAILTTTKTASELLEINDKYGSLEVGKNADFLVLDANPLEDIKTLGRSKQVYKNGLLVVGQFPQK